MTTLSETRAIQAELLESYQEELSRRKARRDYLEYLKYVWWEPHPLKIGIHTKAIAQRITEAVEDYLVGISTFMVVLVPFRHGKSDLMSRALPGYFLGRCISEGLRPSIVQTGYGAKLIQGFSRKAKGIIRSRPYQRLFPTIRVSKTKSTDATWTVDVQEADGSWVMSTGEVNAAGVQGGIVGTGGDIIIVDDYCKSRREAESETFLRSTWEAFRDDILTRRAPTSIGIVCATPWNVDDVIGRIRSNMDENPDFPQFEFFKFPARGPADMDGVVQEYEGEYLFQERFPAAWYRGHYATLGSYSSAGLLDCSPEKRGGNLFNVDTGFVIHDSLDDFPDTLYVRSWDLASTEKQTQKDDPDYTAGGLVGMTTEKYDDFEFRDVWIKDFKIGQWETTQRNGIIKETARKDGPEVPVLVEAVAGYVDTYKTLKKILKGIRDVYRVKLSGDKFVRAEPLVPICEAGNIHILRATWNELVLKHFRTFPQGHDDAVDSVSNAIEFLASRSGLPVSRESDIRQFGR